MSTHKITHYIEIPVEIEFEYQPRENPTLEYSGCDEDIAIEGIKFDDDIELYGRLSQDNIWGIEQACWDHIKGLEDK